nr:hypothetical protein [uncultured Methanoregula sp.]
MDTGKILIGFAFIILSVALMVTPSSAHQQSPDCIGENGFVVPLNASPAQSPAQQALPVAPGAGYSAITSPDQFSLP